MSDPLGNETIANYLEICRRWKNTRSISVASVTVSLAELESVLLELQHLRANRDGKRDGAWALRQMMCGRIVCHESDPATKFELDGEHVWIRRLSDMRAYELPMVFSNDQGFEVAP